MTFLLDTNVAVRSVMPSDPLHSYCTQALAKLADRGEKFVVGSQVLAEAWSLLTRASTSREGFGLTPYDADNRITQLLRFAILLPEPPDIWHEHHRLLVSCGVSGVQVHDCRLAAWCLLHGVESILTFNSADFARFGVTTVRPNDV